MTEKITFTDSETNETVEFAVEEETQLNGVRYVLVSDGAEEESDAYILKEIKTDSDEAVYEIVDDETEFLALAKVFAELADDEVNIEY